MPPTPTIEQIQKTINKCQNPFLQKYVILEGFRQNGYQIRNQRKKLRISALVKIDFGHFLKNVKNPGL